MEKNIVTTTGLDPILLHHFIKYYKQLGVDNFYVVVWGDSKEVKYDEIVNVLKRYDLEVYKDLRDVNNGSPQFLTDIYNEVISIKPNDWWLVADLDEFAVFPKPLKEFVYESDIDVVYGMMIDRIGEDGKLSELEYDDDIWKKFPNVGLVSHNIRENNNIWCGLLKGKYELGVGQHGLKQINFDINKVKIQVHNFTWKKSDIQKIKYYMKLWKPGTTYPFWINEYVRVDNYLKKNKKIDILDDKFLIERCPDDKFDSYSEWGDLLMRGKTWDENFYKLLVGRI
jgi:hypothetical protein